jgi:hypothetical protein
MEDSKCCGRNTTGTGCNNAVGFKSIGLWYGTDVTHPVTLCMKHAKEVMTDGFYTMLKNRAYLKKKFDKTTFLHTEENKRLDGETIDQHKIRIAPAFTEFKRGQEHTVREEIDGILESEFQASHILGNPNEFTKRFMENYLISLVPLYHTVDMMSLRQTLDQVMEPPQMRNNDHLGELGRLATDNQNVHTSVVVENVLANLGNLFKSQQVSNEEINSMGLFCEIMTACSGMTDEAKKTLSEKYFTKEKIYDIQDDRIYAKTLLAVWKFIKDSPHKEDLVVILKEELTDNIGMCAQGNLTRLLNVLNGYLDGMEPEKKTINDEFSELQRSTMSREDKLSMGKWLLDRYEINDEELRNIYLENI